MQQPGSAQQQDNVPQEANAPNAQQPQLGLNIASMQNLNQLPMDMISNIDIMPQQQAVYENLAAFPQTILSNQFQSDEQRQMYDPEWCHL